MWSEADAELVDASLSKIMVRDGNRVNESGSNRSEWRQFIVKETGEEDDPDCAEERQKIIREEQCDMAVDNDTLHLSEYKHIYKRK